MADVAVVDAPKKVGFSDRPEGNDLGAGLKLTAKDNKRLASVVDPDVSAEDQAQAIAKFLVKGVDEASTQQEPADQQKSSESIWQKIVNKFSRKASTKNPQELVNLKTSPKGIH